MAQKNLTVKYSNDANLIKVDPDPQHVRPSDGNNVVMRWVLDSQVAGDGWSFPTDGIAFGSNGGQFTLPVNPASGNQFIMINARTQMGQFKYTVKLVKGSQSTVLDPTIINDNSEP